MNAPLELIETVEPVSHQALQVAAAATPAQLLQIAVERGADLAYVEKLMDLKERHEAGEARKAHAAAVAAFKSEAVTIIKGKLITDGPLKGKKHADLFDVVSAVTPALSKHGLSISWKPTKDDKDWIEVTCYLKHAAGHVESVSMGGAPDTGPGRNAIQARCSTKTYLERYTATAILGMAAMDADDDGKGGADDPLNQPKNFGLTDARAKVVRSVAGAALRLFNEGDEVGAYGEASGLTDNEEKLALWSILKPHSALRSAIKRMADAEAAAQRKLEAERQAQAS